MAPKLAVLALVACAVAVLAPDALAQYRGGVAPPESATDSGDTINQIYWVVLAACAFVFVAVESVLLAFVFRFRRRRDTPDADGPQIHGNTRLEVIWTLVPALALVALAVYTFIRLPDVEAEPAGAATSDAITVDVRAYQFYWDYGYGNGALSFDTLYLPVGRTVTLRISSADVPHSWWVPELTGKKDAIPGQVNDLSFTPQRTGTFARGKCGEMCGIQHAVMLTTVKVLPGDEFDAWLDENETPAAVELGQSEWAAACAKCHGPNGEGDIGPRIAENGTLVDFDALDRLIRREGQDLDANQGYMPPVGKGWSDAQVRALIEYVRSNEKLAPPTEGEGGSG